MKNSEVGVVQATPALFDLEKRVDLVISWIHWGAAAGCELLLFPESFIPCYPRGLTFEAIVGRCTDKCRTMWLDYWEIAWRWEPQAWCGEAAVLAKSKLDFDCVGHYSQDDVFHLAVVNQPETLRILP